MAFSDSNLFRFDWVLSSETIYNVSDYESLHDAIDYGLKADGKA